MLTNDRCHCLAKIAALAWLKRFFMLITYKAERSYHVKNRLQTRQARLRNLFICGFLSSILYIAADVLAGYLWPGYNYTSQAVSELKAIGAVTRPALTITSLVYSTLVLAFGIGIWKSREQKLALRLAGIFLILVEIAGILTTLFFPMHLRGEGISFTDSMHKILTAVSSIFILLSIGCAANSFGRGFLVYSITTMVLLVFFGSLAASDAPNLEQGLPTPWLGLNERISIGSYLVWLATLSLLLKRNANSSVAD